jgi:hypothetical protein
MNIIQRAIGFVQSLWDLSKRTAWDWRHCPKCGDTLTCRWGTYTRHPWSLAGRETVVVQRHWCCRCQSSYSEESAWLVRRSWYAREVHRFSLDLWQHGRSSLRRTAEFTRSLLGRQERWLLWRPLDAEPAPTEDCRLGASTVHRWLDGAGEQAKQTVKGQLEGIKSSGEVGADGLWAKLRGGVKRVVLVLVDSATGLVYPPVVVEGEESEKSWQKLFARAKRAGLRIGRLRGVTSDGATGLLGFVGRVLWWVNHQRCVFHIWRGLGGEFARAAAEAAQGLAGEAAAVARKAARQELVNLVRAIVDARSEAEAQLALGRLRAHRLGSGLAERVEEHLDAALVYLNRYNRGLLRVGPEWVWRDFRLRVSRGRNHGSDGRLERAALVWQVYYNFEPAQWRSERKRKYKRPGKSSLEMAGAPPGRVSYLDALRV